MYRKLLLTACIPLIITGCVTKPDQASYADAAQKNDIETLIKQLDVGMGVDTPINKQGETALQLAVKNNNWKQVSLLSERGANPFLRNPDNLTAIDFVSESSDEQIQQWAKNVVASVADQHQLAVNALNNNDFQELNRLLQTHSFYWYASPLLSTEAVSQQCVKCLDTLQAAGFDLTQKDPSDGWTALMEAVNNGDLSLVKYLVKVEGNVNRQQKDGWSALHLTANKSNKGGDELQAAIANLLIQHGADINLQNIHNNTPLKLAALSDRPEVMRVLLAAKADPKLADTEGWTPLMSAVNRGYFDIVKLLAAQKETLNLQNTQGWTALHLTSNKSNQGGDELQGKIAQHLIAQGADVNYQNKDGITPLYLSAMNNRAFVAQTLLHAKADSTIADKTGWTPLMTAVNRGHIELVDLLSKNKQTINQKDDIGWSPLHLTANKDNKGEEEVQVSIARMLLKRGADLNAQTNKGLTPLALASLRNWPKLVKSLSDAKADGRIPDNEGWTPLMYAVNNGYAEVASLLMKDKRVINLKEKKGWSALHFTANSSNKGGDALQTTLAQQLIKQGADIDAQTKAGDTALNLAAWNNRPAVAKLLLTAKANTTLPDTDGRTPLMTAVRAGNVDVVKMLAAYPKSIQLKDNEGWTALHFTSVGGSKLAEDVRYESAAVLLEKGANANSLNNQLVSPLHFAAMNNYPKLVKLFLKHKADPEIKHKFGRTAEQEAQRKDHWNIVAIFREHQASLK